VLISWVCHSADLHTPAGLPLNVLDAYPVLKEFQHTVATVPEIAAFYR
jgi:hypothetical protein